MRCDTRTTGGRKITIALGNGAEHFELLKRKRPLRNRIAKTKAEALKKYQEIRVPRTLTQSQR